GIVAAKGSGKSQSAVQQLLGGDSAKAKTPAEQDSAQASADGALSAAVEQAGVTGVQPIPGEFAVKESAYRRIDSLLHLPEVKQAWPRGLDFRWSADPVSVGTERYRYLYALEDRPIITGSSLVNAQAQVDQLTSGSEVDFELDRAGGRKFGGETAKHVNDF